MHIDGQWLEMEKTFAVYNPANGEKIADVADGGAEEAVKAVESAHRAFAAWAATTAYERSALLYRAYELMMERQQELAETMTREQGKPLRAALNEVRYGADFLLWFAEEAKRMYGEMIPSARADQRFLVQQMPVGVVAAVTPWNYPISMITRKIGPAVAAGCTVVLKPAEATPMCALAMMRIFEEAGFPAGVINMVTASNPAPVGDVFCTHPLVSKITFTGSTAVGKHLAQAAAPQLKRMSMELGGHAPFIVFDDVDPGYAAKGAALVKFLNSGQACISPNRIFVQRSIADAFVAALTERVAGLKVGDGMQRENGVGPLVGQAALDKVHAQVVDALDKGASLRAGGERLLRDGLERGFFYAPTVLADVNPEMLIYREETFGPVAPVIVFDSQEEVLEMANDTHYGLASYVYTRDISRAFTMFEKLRFGIVGINDINPTSAAAPFGGMKDSGIGREGARQGLQEYLETKLGGFSI